MGHPSLCKLEKDEYCLKKHSKHLNVGEITDDEDKIAFQFRLFEYPPFRT